MRGRPSLWNRSVGQSWIKVLLESFVFLRGRFLRFLQPLEQLILLPRFASSLSLAYGSAPVGRSSALRATLVLLFNFIQNVFEPRKSRGVPCLIFRTPLTPQMMGLTGCLSRQNVFLFTHRKHPRAIYCRRCSTGAHS